MKIKRNFIEVPITQKGFSELLKINEFVCVFDFKERLGFECDPITDLGMLKVGNYLCADAYVETWLRFKNR